MWLRLSVPSRYLFSTWFNIGQQLTPIRPILIEGELMANAIKTGTVLIAETVLLSMAIRFESEPYVDGWRLVKNIDSKDLDQIVSNAGWNFFYIAGVVETNVFGSDEEKATRKAIKKVIANQKSKNFNCLEITRVAAKRSMGLPYVSVSAHSRHIQKEPALPENHEAKAERYQPR
jgi:hypothetical protein